jgi:hypothetical protein
MCACMTGVQLDMLVSASASHKMNPSTPLTLHTPTHTLRGAYGVLQHTHMHA